MTKLVYLGDTYLYEHDANVSHFGVDEKGSYCVLNETIFYPQGGGQASDQGTLSVNGNASLITFVGYIDGEVRHYGDFSTILGSEGKSVHLKIDKERRILNSKAHTAGHLIQCVVEEINNKLKAVKGYHFPDGSYVEFIGDSDIDPETQLEKINENLKKMIGDATPNRISMVSREELLKLCPDLPYEIPENKPTRVMAIGNFVPVPCGGTHLASMGELGSVTVTKIKKKKDRTKVSYSFT